MRAEIIPCSSLSAVVGALAKLSPDASLALVLHDACSSRAREAARALLPRALAALTGQSAASIQIEKDARGKPRLVGGGAAFNIAHARAYSMLAFSCVPDIGCDIEDRFVDEDVMGQCRLLLHPSELKAVEVLAPTQRQEAFGRFWVRKEAVLKGAGAGFLYDPREVITGLRERHPEWPGDAGPRFFIHNQFIAEGCFTAVASMDANCEWLRLEC